MYRINSSSRAILVARNPCTAEDIIEFLDHASAQVKFMQFPMMRALGHVASQMRRQISMDRLIMLKIVVVFFLCS